VSSLWNGSANTLVARQWLSSSHVVAAIYRHATIEGILEAVFSVRSVPKNRFLLLSDNAGLLMWGAVSNDMRGLSFKIAAGPRQRSHSRAESRGSHELNLLSQIRDSPNLEGQVPVWTTSSRYIAPAQIAQVIPSIIPCSFGPGDITCPHSCSLATAVVLLPVHVSVTWQWVYRSQYHKIML
jgi:hypothetical protein